jgi:phospholipid/cholesterol/gamma-HCH transport system ATP-binding protein
MDSTENLVTIRNLYFSWEDRVIFSNVNIDIRRGKITAIMGPSGTGKTTLLKLIGGLLNPSEGFIEINGENIHLASRKRLYQLRHEMGMLFQTGALFTNLTAFENVAFPLREHTTFSEEKISEIVLQKLDAVGLKDAKDLNANQLSGGMVRRVALARAMALNPQLIMYDEPFAGLDPIALNAIAKLIRKVSSRFNITAALVSHDVEETFRIADYVYLIQDGTILGQGTPQALRLNADHRIRQFIDGVSFDEYNVQHSLRPQTTESFISA